MLLMCLPSSFIFPKQPKTPQLPQPCPSHLFPGAPFAVLSEAHKARPSPASSQYIPHFPTDRVVSWLGKPLSCITGKGEQQNFIWCEKLLGWEGRQLVCERRKIQREKLQSKLSPGDTLSVGTATAGERKSRQRSSFKRAGKDYVGLWPHFSSTIQACLPAKQKIRKLIFLLCTRKLWEASFEKSSYSSFRGQETEFSFAHCSKHWDNPGASFLLKPRNSPKHIKNTDEQNS